MQHQAHKALRILILLAGGIMSPGFHLLLEDVWYFASLWFIILLQPGSNWGLALDISPSGLSLWNHDSGYLLDKCSIDTGSRG